MQVRSLRVDP
jgi:hypothetical protein